MTSLALAMVIGAAALYLASPLGRDPAPESAAVVSPTEAPEQDAETGVVSGITVAPQAEPAASAEVVPDAEGIAAPEQRSAPEQQSAPEQPAEPETAVEPCKA